MTVKAATFQNQGLMSALVCISCSLSILACVCSSTAVFDAARLFVQADQFLLSMAVDELPGVGWSMAQKLQELSIKTVADVRASRKERLQRELGNKTGETAVVRSAEG